MKWNEIHIHPRPNISSPHVRPIIYPKRNNKKIVDNSKLQWLWPRLRVIKADRREKPTTTSWQNGGRINSRCRVVARKVDTLDLFGKTVRLHTSGIVAAGERINVYRKIRVAVRLRRRERGFGQFICPTLLLSFVQWAQSDSYVIWKIRLFPPNADADQLQKKVEREIFNEFTDCVRVHVREWLESVTEEKLKNEKISISKLIHSGKYLHRSTHIPSEFPFEVSSCNNTLRVWFVYFWILDGTIIEVVADENLFNTNIWWDSLRFDYQNISKSTFLLENRCERVAIVAMYGSDRQ